MCSVQPIKIDELENTKDENLRDILCISIKKATPNAG